jgi:SAM-dependent methyltransferase
MTENGFLVLDSCPVLISEILCDTVCDPKSINSFVVRSSPDTPLKKIKSWVRGISKVTIKNCNIFVDNLKKNNRTPRVCVIGGGTLGLGSDALYEDKSIRCTSVDIYQTNLTDLVCDAHYLPFKDSYFDGVWIQAVLEHVVEPQVVIAEIHRVLKSDGIVYAETPFMQQVHEGAYDFSRYTVLGHRYLFRDFDEISIGGNGGAEVALSWSLRYFVLAITNSISLSKLTGIFFTLVLRPFSFFIKKESLYDSSSGVFFLGSKSTHRLTHKELVRLYSGKL